MKTSQYSPNPAIDTNWFIEKGGKVFLVKIKGTVCTGSGDKFKITGYILKYDHLEETQEVDATRLMELIKSGIVKPNYNSEGALIPELTNAN